MKIYLICKPSVNEDLVLNHLKKNYATDVESFPSINNDIYLGRFSPIFDEDLNQKEDGKSLKELGFIIKIFTILVKE